MSVLEVKAFQIYSKRAKLMVISWKGGLSYWSSWRFYQSSWHSNLNKQDCHTSYRTWPPCVDWRLRIAWTTVHRILFTVLKMNVYLPTYMYPWALHCVSICVSCRKYASIRGLTENWRICRPFSGIRRKYDSLVCLHEFITLYCRLQYLHCNFVYIVFHVSMD